MFFSLPQIPTSEKKGLLLTLYLAHKVSSAVYRRANLTLVALFGPYKKGCVALEM